MQGTTMRMRGGDLQALEALLNVEWEKVSHKRILHIFIRKPSAMANYQHFNFCMQ